MGFKDEMEQFDEQAAEDAARPRPGKLPDGPHQVIIAESRIEEEDGLFTWVTKFTNPSGSIRKWYNLDHEVGRSIAAQDYTLMGYDGKMSELEDWLIAEGPIGLICEINVKTKAGDKRDFTDVYVNRVLGKGNVEDFTPSEPAEGEFPAGNEADDDIPF